ncbi:MAG: hypothetical protein JW388_1049 [Nitrospira sp.]|nr:hypothetical protein [Nitrospira sp.]
MELDQCWVSAYHLQVRGGLNLLSVDWAGFQFQFWTHHGCHWRTANRQPDGAFAEGRTFAGIDFPGRCLLKCIVMSLVYLVGMVVIWIALEANGKPLPE